jgi:hypothetical protein
MAIFEVKKEKNKDIIQLLRKINYITDWCATRQDLIYGSAVSVLDTYEEMVAVKNVFDKANRSAYRHYILSIEENEKIQLLRFKNLGIEVCEILSGFYGNYQVLMAVHINTDHLHIHYVINTIDYLTGNRLDLNRGRLEELKYGISKKLYKYQLLPVKMKGLGDLETDEK